MTVETCSCAVPQIHGFVTGRAPRRGAPCGCPLPSEPRQEGRLSRRPVFFRPIVTLVTGRLERRPSRSAPGTTPLRPPAKRWDRPPARGGRQGLPALVQCKIFGQEPRQVEALVPLQVGNHGVLHPGGPFELTRCGESHRQSFDIFQFKLPLALEQAFENLQGSHSVSDLRVGEKRPAAGPQRASCRGGREKPQELSPNRSAPPHAGSVGPEPSPA